MRKSRLVIFVTALFLSQTVFSQDMGVNISMGLTPSVISPGNIYFSYIDESPSQDYLYSEVSMQEKKRSFTMSGAFDFKAQSKIFFRGELELMFGNVSGFEVNFGGGYEYNVNDKFTLRPMFMFAFGDAGIKLGDIYQNDLYIEVNRTQFYSQSVSVKLKRTHFIAIPEIELGYPINEQIELIVDMGYQLPVNIKTSKLYFSGYDENNASVSASESIMANNVYLSLNGEKFTTNFVGVNGLALRAGVYLYLY